MAKQAAGLLCALIGIGFWTGASADVYLDNSASPDDFITIRIAGDITQRDLAFFRSRSKDFETKRLQVWLNSRGGEVAAAMEIGRIIRSVDGWTEIGVQGRCYSSCALIFIAGVWRQNYGELGLHRPYFASAPLSREQIEKQAPLMRSAVKNYVEEMGITDSFFERMFNTNPSDIEILRSDQSEKIVPTTDALYDEISTAESAKKYGLTTSEYRKRDSLTSFCWDSTPGIPEYEDCREPNIWGLSLEDYRSRLALMKARCAYSDSEKQILSATPRKDRLALPFVAKNITCQVNTMQGK